MMGFLLKKNHINIIMFIQIEKEKSGVILKMKKQESGNQVINFKNIININFY